MVKMHHADFKKYTVTIDCAIIEKCGELHDECDASVLDKCEAVRVDINKGKTNPFMKVVCDNRR